MIYIKKRFGAVSPTRFQVVLLRCRIAPKNKQCMKFQPSYKYHFYLYQNSYSSFQSACTVVCLLKQFFNRRGGSLTRWFCAHFPQYIRPLRQKLHLWVWPAEQYYVI
jgi:hypothetical protein